MAASRACKTIRIRDQGSEIREERGKTNFFKVKLDKDLRNGGNKRMNDECFLYIL